MSKALQIPPAVRLLVAERDGHYCARCGTSVVNVPSSVHHRYLRGMGGSRDQRINDPRNLVQMCGSGTTECHGWAHHNRTDARDAGWIIRSLDLLDEPMRTVFGTRVTLTADGDREDFWPFDDVLPIT